MAKRNEQHRSSERPTERTPERRAHEPPVREAPPAQAAPRHAPATRTDERSIGELFKELSRETKMLIRQEIQLAKTEAAGKASEAGRDVGMLAAGGFVAYAGLIVLIIAIGLLLGTFMPDWLGLAIASATVLTIGYVLVQKGIRSLKNIDFALERTSKTLQEDKLWMKQEAQDVKRDPKHLGTDER